MYRLLIVMVLLSCGMPAAAGIEESAMLSMWAVDPLIKVFKDAVPEAETEADLEAARGEYASLQIVVRANQDVKGLRASLKPLVLDGGSAALVTRPPRFVGYVPVDRPTQTPSHDQLRTPPADYPDPLLECETLDAGAQEARPIWITVHVPKDATPGTYRSELAVTGACGEVQVSARQPVSVRVHAVQVGRTRLWVTDWFSPHALHMQISPEPYSDAYYALLRRYARNMAEHCHTAALISPLALADCRVAPDGKLAFDFSRFDRWVQIFQEEGVVGLIEGGHIGGRKSGWNSPFVVTVKKAKEGQVAEEQADPSGPDADVFYAQWFPALVAHLREKDWLKSYVQHLADEPIPLNVDSYRAMAKLARTYGPELRIIEACHTKDLAGAMDIWVPQLNFVHEDYEHYRARQQAGEEVWFYTCVFPQGEYANRFIELPLLKTRLLHWINYRYGLTGYLHWGYNQWTADSPFTHTTRPHGGPPYLPAGDAWIVYPGKDGPLDSIRFEAMRDGIVDHELLSMLGERDPEAAQRLAAMFVPDFDRYNTDVKAFREARRELLERLGRPGL